MRISGIKTMATDALENRAVECAHIEYKKSATFKNRILKTVCAFANNYMNCEIGLLFVGVEEVDDPVTGAKAVPKRPIAGIAKDRIESVENSLKSLVAEVRPKPRYHMLNLDIDDTTCIVLAVEPGTEGPYMTSRKAENTKGIGLKAGRYIRVNRDSRLPNSQEEFELLREFADFIPGAELKIIREVQGTDKMQEVTFDGPIWRQVQRAIEYFQEVVLKEVTIREDGLIGHRIIRNWPSAMFAELVTNCVLHKNYDKSDYAAVYVYSDKMSFVNHNRPLPPVTIEDMRSKTTFDNRSYLNPEIKEMFFALGLIESYGSGLRRAKNAMVENGNPALAFYPDNAVDDYLEVVAPVNVEYALLRETAQETSKETSKETGHGALSEQDEPILNFFSKRPAASVKELCAELEIKYGTAQDRISRLRKAGRLTHDGPTKTGHWVVHEEN